MLEMLSKKIGVNLNLISIRITFISCKTYVYGYLIFKTENITVLQKENIHSKLSRLRHRNSDAAHYINFMNVDVYSVQNIKVSS